jgi:hypothetical protein
MGTNALTLPDMKHVKSEAVDTLFKTLGLTKAAIFIRENLFQKTDYLEIRDKIFGDKNAAELYKDITDWKDKKTAR